MRKVWQQALRFSAGVPIFLAVKELNFLDISGIKGAAGRERIAKSVAKRAFIRYIQMLGELILAP